MTTNTYTNLARVRDHLGLNTGAASAQTQDDAVLLNFMGRASRSIDRYTRRKFYPRVELRRYDHKEAQRVLLDDDLLELTTLATQNGACTVASGVMWLSTGDNWNRPPYNTIILDDSSGSTLNFSGTAKRANEVTGIWGYHEDWSNAWVDTGACLNDAYSASGTSLGLAGVGSAGAGASDVFGEHPRIAPGDLLKIGDEYIQVLGGGTSGNASVLVHGFMNGTTAATHASGASIARFAPEPDIEWATRRLTGWLFGQKDVPYSNKTANVQFGTIEIPQGMATDIKQKIDRYVRLTIQVSP